MSLNIHSSIQSSNGMVKSFFDDQQQQQQKNIKPLTAAATTTNSFLALSFNYFLSLSFTNKIHCVFAVVIWQLANQTKSLYQAQNQFNQCDVMWVKCGCEKKPCYIGCKMVGSCKKILITFRLTFFFAVVLERTKKKSGFCNESTNNLESTNPFDW